MNRAWGLLVASLVVFLLGVAAVTHTRAQRETPAIAEAELAPEGTRVRVQVLNTTTTRGLARRATQLLRDRGFDVVEVGTTAQTRDTTIVLDLSGHPDWARRVAELFRPARVEARPDSSRYLDIAVLVGASWRPPAEPFYP